MKISQTVLRGGDDIARKIADIDMPDAQLVLVFGSIDLLKGVALPLQSRFPGAVRMGCSTAGEISSQGVSDASCVVTALHFDAVRLHACSTRLQSMEESQAAGARLGEQLPRPGLRAVLVLGQGVAINGSALIAGLSSQLGAEVPIVGGLAGDAAAFRETWVLDQDEVRNDRLVCLGLYGEGLVFSHGTFGGWSPFGPARKVTRCENNVLYELDGEPALDVYKRYLGEHAKDLPASGLLFPFSMLGSDHAEVGLTRTILGMDEAAGSLTLAGDIEPDGYLRLMHASVDALVDGAEAAAVAASKDLLRPGPGLALLVSCVGRKLVLGGRVDEEVEAVSEVLGADTVLTGFYSNGEISPFSGQCNSRLHNQTMTITFLAEKPLA